MMQRAEQLAWAAGYTQMAVIAGVGSRGFYRKLGYALHPGEGQFMVRDIDASVMTRRWEQKQEDESTGTRGEAGWCRCSQSMDWCRCSQSMDCSSLSLSALAALSVVMLAFAVQFAVPYGINN